MEFGSPYFLVVFFGIFHVVGGLAFGKGVRERISDVKAGSQLIVWGLLMGGSPVLFDWFFLIRVGDLVSGLMGPTLFVAAAIAGGIFFTGELSRKNEKSIGAILMGGTALMLGLMLVPYLIRQAQTQDDLELIDYLCGGFIPLIFILVGLSFTWTGFSAIRKNLSFGEHIAGHEMEMEEKSQGKRRK